MITKRPAASQPQGPEFTDFYRAFPGGRLALAWRRTALCENPAVDLAPEAKSPPPGPPLGRAAQIAAP